MSIQSQLDQMVSEASPLIAGCASLVELEDIRLQFLGKKGALTEILKGLATIDAAERPAIGMAANQAKTALSTLLDDKKSELETASLAAEMVKNAIDVTLPGVGTPLGHRHPISQTIDEISQILGRLGFAVEEGPEIESDYYNFEALNIPDDHPARDSHDTFYMMSGHVLRTHTSPVQVHVMEREKPPIRIIVPGRVYRRDADASHSPAFHQIEGLLVDEKVTFAELKGTLDYFLKALFGAKQSVRFRPSYFPFTEPSCEVDVACVLCQAKGCAVCKHTGWLEILGAGMVNRNVFRKVGYDPDQVTGFAFGVGVERIAMLKLGIPSIKLLTDNDLRFLKQF